MTYSIDIKNIVISNFIDKIKKITISKTLKLSLTTINNWEYLYRENITNKTYLSKENCIQHQHGLNKKYQYIDSIKNYVNEHEGCTLNDIVKNVTNDNLSNSSICRILKENNITRKKIQNRIVCKDINKIKEDRQNFANNDDNNDFINYISIDESSFCITGFYIYSLLMQTINIEKY